MKVSRLVRRDLARSKKKLATVGSAVSAGVAVLVLFGALGSGLYRGVVEPLLPRLPLDLIKVEPHVLSLGMFAFDASKAGGGGLDPRTVERLATIEGVSSVYPVLGTSFPLRAQGGARFLGRGIRTDLFATGLSPELVGKDIKPGFEFKDPGPNAEVVPIVVARRLLDLYNSTVAPAIKKPRLSEEAVVGFTFEVMLGSSYVRGTPDPSKTGKVIAQIVGFSPHASLVGMTIPEATMRRWNQKYGDGDTPIVSAYLETSSPRIAGRVAAAVEKMGLRVDDTMKIVGAIVGGAGAVLSLFVIVLLGLAAFAIAQTFFLLVGERRTELAVLRAMGAKQRDLRRLVLIEAGVVGVIAGAVGLALGVLGALGLDVAAAALIPDIPFKPSSFVAFPPTLLGGAFLLGVLAALAGAYLPALLAARSDPARALRE